MATQARRFTFGPCLGRGSFGEVYSATMRSPGGLETAVAVKLLRADIDLRGEAVRRLRDEGRLLARMNHPAILKVFDLVTLRGRIALITERVDGADLADCIPKDSDPGIAVRPLLQALGQVAGGLHAASTAEGPEGPLRLVHRDLKPSNIRIDRHGHAKLLDFGIARFDASDREVRTASDLVVGSVPYMAPERFIERDVLPSSDVFSLGATLFEGIAGERFYGSSNVGQITGLALYPERYEETIRPRIEALPVARGVKELLHDLVRIQPDQRPTAAEAAARLEELSDEVSGPTLRMWCRDRRWPTPKSLAGSMQGETVEEGELEPMPSVPPSGAPVLNRAPLPTIEPGQSLASMASVFDNPNRAANPTLAPPIDEDSAAFTVEDTPVARPSPKDSVWERPYTTEGEQPLLRPPTADAILSEPPERPPAADAILSEPPADVPVPAGRSLGTWLMGVGLVVVLVAVIALLVLLVLTAAGVGWYAA